MSCTWPWSKLSFETIRLSDRSDFSFSGMVADRSLSSDSAIDLNFSCPRISSWKIFRFLHLITKDPSMGPFPLVTLLPLSVPDWLIRSMASMPVCKIWNSSRKMNLGFVYSLKYSFEPYLFYSIIQMPWFWDMIFIVWKDLICKRRTLPIYSSMNIK